jgi:hypothetical protein
MHRSARLVVVLGLLGLVSACTSASSHHTLEGSFIIHAFSADHDGAACLGAQQERDLADLKPGAPVIIRDDNRKVLSTVHLSAGVARRVVDDPGAPKNVYDCTFTWTARVADAPHYRVQVGSQVAQTYARDDLKHVNWAILQSVAPYESA